MTNTYAYEKRSYYPHMMPEDIAVWERFISQNPNAYDACEYDVPVGKVPDFVANDPDTDQASMERLYKKKIDVLAYGTDKFDLIELKPVCTMSTIGQVNGYRHFYIRDYSPERPPRAVVICGEASEDVKEYAEAQDVAIIVV